MQKVVKIKTKQVRPNFWLGAHLKMYILFSAVGSSLTLAPLNYKCAAGNDSFSQSLVCGATSSELKAKIADEILSFLGHSIFPVLTFLGSAGIGCVRSARCCDIRPNKASPLSSPSLALYLCSLLLVFQRNAEANSCAGLERQSSHGVWTGWCCTKFKDVGGRSENKRVHCRRIWVSELNVYFYLVHKNINNNN